MVRRAEKIHASGVWEVIEGYRRAGEQGRCFVSHDVRDLPDLSLHFEGRGLPHAGVILVPRM